MKRKADRNTKILLIISLVFIIIGSIVLLYPTVSNYFAQKNQTEAITQYDTMIVQLDKDTLEEELQKAQEYNENLSGEPVHDPFIEGSGYALPKNYKEILNITDDGVMGYVEVPKILVKLPIYHGTSEEVLEKGIGHIQTTSLPIGGNSTHSVLTGHTGLPSAELFTRLDELEIGDIFYIKILDKTLTYKVYETKIILPDEIDELQVFSGKDLLTLVTCTPYGVNSHRLLVKAERTEFEEYEQTKFETGENNTNHKNYYLTGIQIGVIILIVILIITFILYNLFKTKDKK